MGVAGEESGRPPCVESMQKSSARVGGGLPVCRGSFEVGKWQFAGRLKNIFGSIWIFAEWNLIEKEKGLGERGCVCLCV